MMIMEWDLTFESLTDDEARQLGKFFSEMRGNLGAFGFLDPLGNLLRWSEDLSDPIWEKDALLDVTSGHPDVFGSDSGHVLFNSTQLPRGVQQTVNAPNEYGYCFSAWVRSATGGRVSLTIGNHRVERTVNPFWTRVFNSRSGEATGESVTFQLEIEANGSVEVCGLQAEPQLAPSPYRRNGPAGGTYPDARFRDAVLTISAKGPDRNSCRFTVVSNANSL
jgi:hypothetical protein